MDPLSTTLAVVSLATAIKDIVELGQKIHESFAKASNNLHSAQSVAEDIKEMAQEIKAFYEVHENQLDNMKDPDFRSALQGLLVKLRTFETSILPLLPQAGGRRRDRFIRGWDSWRNNNKIEANILDLRNDMMKVIQRYMLKSAMRTEIKLETIEQETSRGLVNVHKGMAQGFQVIRDNISALHLTTATPTMAHISYKSLGISSEDVNRNIVMLAESTPSTSMPILRSPDVITEELMTAAYIKFQINSIAITIEKMSASSALLIPATNNAVEFCISSNAEHLSMSITPLRHHIVREVTLLRDHLDILRTHLEGDRVYTISIRSGARALNYLSVGLAALSMGDESIIVGNWAITLNRMLVDTPDDREPYRCAELTLFLLNQSIRSESRGDQTGSLRAIDEAYTLSQDLWNQYGGQTNVKILYSKVLLQYAHLLDRQRSLAMSIEAVKILEEILNVQGVTWSESLGTVVHINTSFLDGLSSPTSPIPAVIDYAGALEDLAAHMYIGGNHQSAKDLVLLGISVRRKIVSIHGHEYRVHLALALASLVNNDMVGCIPGDQLFNLVDECGQLLRELAEKNPMFHARNLVNVLSKKASTLESLGQGIEAITTWEEVASLAGQIIQDSSMCARALGSLAGQFRRLKRYEDAVKTGMLAINTYREDTESELALKYQHLSRDLLALRRYKEAMDAARTSVTLYRRLVMKDPSPWSWMSYLTQSVAHLAYCLAALGDHSEALIAWKESVVMLDNFANSDPLHTVAGLGVLEYHLSALCIHGSLSHILEDEEKCILVCSTTVKYRRQLSQSYPARENIMSDLWWAEFWYAYNMLRIGHLEEGQQYIDQWLNTWSNQEDAVSQSVDMYSKVYGMMMILKADMLDAQGSTEEATLVSGKVYNQFTLSGDQNARLWMHLGDNYSAIQAAETGLQISHDCQLSQDCQFFNCKVWSYHAVSLAALTCQNYER